MSIVHPVCQSANALNLTETQQISRRYDRKHYLLKYQQEIQQQLAACCDLCLR
jgi:hypothetical protein